jgi:hypothetical protein
MDPYLESPHKWSDHYHELISGIRAELNRQLRPRYFARLEERVYLMDENDPSLQLIIPDVHLRAGERSSRPESPQGTVSVLETVQPIDVTTFIEEEVHEARVEVIDSDTRNVIAVIEVLSPTNKVQSSAGQKSYIAKRRDIMLSGSHLVEIDLLRGGTRIFVREALPRHDYLVHVSRRKSNGLRHARVWPIPLIKRLPIIPIPLREGDEDALIDLQQILNAAYERGAYDLDIDYTRDPIPPLPADQAEWARKIIADYKPA